VKPFRIIKAPIPIWFVIIRGRKIVGNACTIAQAMDYIGHILRDEADERWSRYPNGVSVRR
jgi:hypothetical protein